MQYQYYHIYGVEEFPAPWEACSYTPEIESEFIAHHLGPMLNETHPDVKLFIFDHNKDHAPLWADEILPSSTSNSSLNKAAAAKYVDGVAVHWYADSGDRLLDGALGAANMHRLLNHIEERDEAIASMNDDVVKDTLILGTESCHCPSTGYAGGDIRVAWARAERYAHTILSDLASGSSGWIEWNLLLDSIGGPNHLGNMCDAPILAVPHRALDADIEGIPHLMSWEVDKNPFGRIIGDERTKAELNALGISSKYLDVGLAVQPMYYYMGHISRYVRPGSTPVKALVDSSEQSVNIDVPDFPSRTFRASEAGIAGGGLNELARDGTEATLWPCEGSTRQNWKLNEKNQLQVFGQDWLGRPTSSCLSNTADDDLQTLVLTSCDEKYGNPGVFQIEAFEDSPSYIKMKLEGTNKRSANKCVLAKAVKNNGGSYGVRGGSQVDIGDCSEAAAKWKFSSGEILSTYFDGGEVCLTTGWPFLQVGAFKTPSSPEGSKTVLILNEAEQSANYVLKDGEIIIATASIPSHSIQTIVYDSN